MSKVKAITGIRVEIEPHRHVTRWCRTPEDKARELKNWARDFEEFIRDHRSQDPVSLEVITDLQDQCSHCHREWEEDADGPLCCQTAQDEWNAERLKGAA